MTSLETIKPDRSLALMLAKKQLAEFVCDAVNLEGIHYTLPEVQTLLDGVTIGGHRLSDQRIALNQAEAWHFIFNSVADETFALSQSFVCKLHAIAGFEEALLWGRFRDKQVTIAGTDYMPPAGNVLENIWLDVCFDYMTLDVKELYQKAIGLFLDMARNQFFFDVNKRMGRFMMNGVLLARGYPAINLQAKHQQIFNQLMLDFYHSNNKQPMTQFMLNCLDERLIKIMSE